MANDFNTTHNNDATSLSSTTTTTKIVLTKEQFESIWFKGRWRALTQTQNGAIARLHNELFNDTICDSCENQIEEIKNRMLQLRTEAEKKYGKN